MSSLICFSTDEFAVVATDTLGVDAEVNPFVAELLFWIVR